MLAFIYVFEKQSDRVRDSERKRSSILGFTPQFATTVWSWELGVPFRSPTWVSEIRVPGPSFPLADTVTGRWIRSGAARTGIDMHIWDTVLQASVPMSHVPLISFNIKGLIMVLLIKEMIPKGYLESVSALLLSGAAILFLLQSFWCLSGFNPITVHLLSSFAIFVGHGDPGL